ncbi:MAG: CBS domain-containing protein [Ardenticatenaceae bacterium]|nr:CBS domain-containing protein [Ardenticatenaceae bacterium]MCB9004870.1 CBS domain-containing protein [Ardenticatenaceae bacterium]
MIPKRMETFLQEHLPQQALENRLIREDGRCYIEFGPLDVEQLAGLGIVVDNLGPRLVACMWDEAAPIEIGGYLVVDNLAMGQPSMGGIRMLPNVTPSAIHNLARGMTLKNAAAQLPYGGGKSGIVAERGLSAEEHTAVVRGFARLIKRYSDTYLPGPDVGTNDADMKTVAIVNGIDSALSKPVDMGGNRIDELGAAAGGTIIALDALLQEMPRLTVLPQFANLQVPSREALTVLIQGFGAVGAHAARILQEMLPGAKVTGISDLLGYLYDEAGLPGMDLFHSWQQRGLVTRHYYETALATADGVVATKYATAPNDLLRESSFCLIPAAPIAHYLDTEAATNPSMTTDRMGDWAVIVEGANTYSPDPARKAVRARMEREVYRQRGTLIATDYLVNSGGVIFAAQEHLIKTPAHLRVPDEMLGDETAVNQWLHDHAAELARLAAERLDAAIAYRDRVIRRNMSELVELLISDADMLPCEAAEQIAIRRIAARESDRVVADIMDPIPTIDVKSTVQQAASELVTASSSILAVVDESGALVGVVTDWDITHATAQGQPGGTPLAEVMTQNAVTACSEDSLLSVVRRLEHYGYSALPVVDGGQVSGKISARLLAQRSLLRLLQSQ